MPIKMVNGKTENENKAYRHTSYNQESRNLG